MAFNDYVAELVGAVPRLPAPYAISLVNRAWAEIRDIRLWSFLLQSKSINVPAMVTTGTVSVTQFSVNITFDATAIAALNASPSQPPIASTSVGVGRQFRIAGQGGSSLISNAGPLYTLLTYNSTTGAATLDQPYQDKTGVGLAYMVYKAYFEPPVTDFVRYRVVTNYTSGYSIIRDALNVPQESLAVFDPQRQSTGDAYYISPFVTDYINPSGTGVPAHEFYPHPVVPSTYVELFERRGQPLSPSQDLPSTFPSHVLVHRAMKHACDWALKNVPMMPELQITNWVQAIESAEASFRETLILAIKQDDTFFPHSPMRVGRYYSQFPLGGQWLQSHALPPGYLQP